MLKENTIQLITYPDSLGDNLSELSAVLDNHITDAVGGVHILPFYPSSADRGFTPLTHMKVDPAFGTWEDILQITKNYRVMSDLMVNHISSESELFKDYRARAEYSPYSDYFIGANKFSHHIPRHYHENEQNAHVDMHYGSRRFQQLLENYVIRPIESLMKRARKIDIIFHKQGVNRMLLKKIYRPRPGSPFIPFTFANKTTRYLWCTFSKDQIDLDVSNPSVRKMFRDAIVHAAQNGISLIRLDAVGYACKRRGTNNFLLPETYDLIASLSEIAHRHGVKILPEVHSDYCTQLDLSGRNGVDYVYDFQLPLLVLQALFSGCHCHLVRWLQLRSNNMITILDTHDGLPVPDVEGLLTSSEIEATIVYVNKKGGNAAMRASGENAQNVDVYQLNVTYFSALDEDDDMYIAARAIQFFIPGIPQVYYVGLFAGKNDIDRLERTGIGRDINRHSYSLDEIKEEMKRPVVKRLMRLMRFRNTQPSFDGVFLRKKSPKNQLILYWQKENSFCEVKIDLHIHKTIIRYFDQKSATVKEFTA